MKVAYEDICHSEIPLIDVRSPSEYLKGHLPSAINIPLFSDQERAIVGTIYKQVGRDQAIKEGISFVNPKMQDFLNHVGKLVSWDKKVHVYCWRGGMRSESFTNFLNSSGFDARRIDGGYKQARHYIRQAFEKKAKMIILGGYTGSGKTDYLKGLASRGFQIIDLEGLACHKGSAFGHINERPQPTNEQFENNLFERWIRLDFTRPLIVEHESNAIGKVRIPDSLFLQMKFAPLIVVEVGLDERVRRLERDYRDISGELLLDSCRRIQSKLGGDRFKKITELLIEKNYRAACALLLDYYDKFYRYALEQKMIQANVRKIYLEGVFSENHFTLLSAEIARISFSG